MDEFKFVIKCFLFAATIIMFSHMKINDQTLENKAELFLQDSSIAHLIQQSAAGGAKVLNQTFQTTRSYLKRKMAQAGGSIEPLESKD